MVPSFILLLGACGAAASVHLHVDPSSTTLAGAQEALRAALQEHGRAVSVTLTLAPGTHRVPSGGLVLTAADSPAAGHTVTWRGSAGTVLSGGDNVTGWALANDPALPAGVYSAPIPPALAGRSSRQLYVDGVRAARTSRPAQPLLPGLAPDATDCPACSYTVDSSEPAAWSNPSDVEFVWSGVASGWSESRCALLNVSASAPHMEPNCTLDRSSEGDCGFPYSTQADCLNNRTAEHPLGCCWVEGGAPPSGHFCIAPAYAPINSTSSTRLTMQQPCLWNIFNRIYQPYGSTPPTTIENVRQHLSTPGQWYLDRARGEVLYFPLPGQDMGAVSAVIAVEEQLVTLQGASRQAFSGVAFAFATWLRPGQGLGLVDQQATASSTCPYGSPHSWYCGQDDVFTMTPGNVALYGASEVDFAACNFTHLGAYGASASAGSQFITFQGCLFTDISAGAVMIGTTDSFNITDVAQWDTNITVADCTMTATGLEYTGSTAVFVAYAANTSITHNLIANSSYSGMTIGWGWGREASRRGGNSIVGNRVEGVQVARCCDGGGIYTLGPQPGSELRGNYLVQGAAAGSWGPSSGNAVYHDNGSGGFRDTQNVIDGQWGTYFFQDDSLGPYGPGAQCPDETGAPGNCGMAFIGNWMRTNAHGTTSHQNTTFANNTV